MGQKQDGNKINNAHAHRSDAGTHSTSTVGISVILPGKRINLRTECIQQLQQLGELLEKGNITHEQYKKLQS